MDRKKKYMFGSFTERFKCRPIFMIFSLVNSERNICTNLELKLSPPSYLLPHYLAKLSMQLFNFTFIICLMSGSIYFMSFYLLISSWDWHHNDIIALFCLLHYSRLTIMKTNVWHSIEQCIIDTSIDQWLARLKTCVSVKSRQLNACKFICVDKQ